LRKEVGTFSKEEGKFPIKYPSPLHLMHYTNSVGYINDRMTP